MKFISAAVFELLANKPEQEKVGICTQASVKNKFFVLFRILQVDYFIAYEFCVCYKFVLSHIITLSPGKFIPPTMKFTMPHQLNIGECTLHASTSV